MENVFERHVLKGARGTSGTAGVVCVAGENAGPCFIARSRFESLLDVSEANATFTSRSRIVASWPPLSATSLVIVNVMDHLQELVRTRQRVSEC